MDPDQVHPLNWSCYANSSSKYPTPLAVTLLEILSDIAKRLHCDSYECIRSSWHFTPQSGGECPLRDSKLPSPVLSPIPEN